MESYSTLPARFNSPKRKLLLFSVYFLACIFVLGLDACDSKNIVFEQSRQIKDSQWVYADSLQYVFPVNDTSKIYNIYLDLKHEKTYAFQNIYLNLHTQFPSGKRIDNRINIDLAEPSGKWNGDCSNKYCTLEIPIQEGAFFNEKGNYTLMVEQYLRQDTLAGIREVGLLLEDTGKKRR